MGTRSGDIDPAIMEFIAKKENLDIDGMMEVLNKKSGVEGMSGVSSDFRDLEAAYNEGNPRAIDACEVFAYRVAKYIGAYVAAMNGVDAIAFTAGIGENTSFIREKILALWISWNRNRQRKKQYPWRRRDYFYTGFKSNCMCDSY